MEIRVTKLFSTGTHAFKLSNDLPAVFLAFCMEITC